MKDDDDDGDGSMSHAAAENTSWKINLTAS